MSDTLAALLVALGFLGISLLVLYGAARALGKQPRLPKPGRREHWNADDQLQYERFIERRRP